MVFFTSSKCYKHQIILSSNDAQLLKSCRSLKIKFFQIYSQCYSCFIFQCICHKNDKKSYYQASLIFLERQFQLRAQLCLRRIYSHQHTVQLQYSVYHLTAPMFWRLLVLKLLVTLVLLALLTHEGVAFSSQTGKMVSIILYCIRCFRCKAVTVLKAVMCSIYFIYFKIDHK